MTLSKNQNTFELTFHSQERLSQKFSNLTPNQVQDSFVRSKMINMQNVHKYNPVFKTRLQKKLNSEPNNQIFVNPYYDIVFIVDTVSKQVVTTYNYSDTNI